MAISEYADVAGRYAGSLDSGATDAEHTLPPYEAPRRSLYGVLPPSGDTLAQLAQHVEVLTLALRGALKRIAVLEAASRCAQGHRVSCRSCTDEHRAPHRTGAARRGPRSAGAAE